MSYGTIQNFQLELEVDGRTRIEIGPRAQDGGFALIIRMRNGDKVITPLYINGVADRGGCLTLSIATPTYGDLIGVSNPSTRGVIWRKVTQTRRTNSVMQVSGLPKHCDVVFPDGHETRGTVTETEYGSFELMIRLHHANLRIEISKYSARSIGNGDADTLYL